MGLFSRIAGVVNSFFQIGGPNGDGINYNSASPALEAKNAANSAFVIMRGATPVGPSDFVTKFYNDTAFKPIIATQQFNGSTALPANSATTQFYVVTTTGANASIGQLLYDNGTGVGTVTVISAPAGGEIVPVANFTGGTISFTAFMNYVWTGAPLNQWVNAATTVTGAVQVIQFGITTATATSVTSIPIGATILRASLNITTAYNATATIAIGSTTVPALLMATTDNFPTVVDLYDALQVTSWNAASVVQATVTTATAGTATVTIEYVTSANP